ncbi:MAG: hypothetical protein CMM30_04985 [Rhodospirillaceae bacterium]|nr:hypothetical protein [Rhodospirillaceae bacterium]|tara:strand:- start:155 stop:553 length:399 start_codon:yes stop_codon:yes gene_type:complete
MNLEHLKHFSQSNSFFSAPRDWGMNTSHYSTPIYEGKWNYIIETLSKIANDEPRTVTLKNNISEGKLQLCQKSLIFKFPDLIWIQAITIDEYSSSVAIFSKAKYGKYDFGVNKKRVLRWIDKLSDKIPIKTS